MGKFAIIVFVTLIMSVLIIRTSDIGLLTNFTGNFAEKHRRLMARNIANSGANIALNQLTMDVTSTAAANDVSYNEGAYSFIIERDTDNPSLGPTEIRVVSIGEYESVVDTVIVLLTRPSFSRFAYFTNQEGNIWFFSQDTLHGPAHTNGYFNMAGSPTFHGKVTSHDIYSSSSPYRKYNSSTDPNFWGGQEWGVPPLSMPSSIPQDFQDAAQDGGMHYNNRYVWMRFQTDGTVDIAAKNTYSTPYSWEYTTHNISSTNGTIYIDYPYYRPLVFVNGTVDGQVTVGSEGYILVDDDLVLQDDPRTNPNSNDMVGLVAAKDVVVYENEYYEDRTIQATIMTLNPYTATTDNFYVYDYDEYPYGTLHLYGGLIQNARGAVGTFSGGSKATGYDKNYHWDPRLRNMSPPNFPMLFVLRKIAWWD